MRALIIAIAALAFAGRTAYAQDPPPPAPYPPTPYPPPVYAQPYPQQPRVAVQLTVDENELLQKGEISQGLQVGGAVANAFLGFGVGQAIQGRWSDTGWIFTLGQGASIALMIGAAIRSVESCSRFDESCNNDQAVGMLVAGAIGFTVFYLWGIVDAVTGPASHNRRVRELRMRLGIPPPMWTRVVPYVNKARDSGGTAGLLLRF